MNRKLDIPRPVFNHAKYAVFIVKYTGIISAITEELVGPALLWEYTQTPLTK